MKQPKYRRVLLKLSGEALSPGAGGILDFDFLTRVAGQIRRCTESGVQVAVIVGAGNIWRGRQGTGMDHCRADHMGMLATVINSIALQDVFLRERLDAVVLSAVEMKAFADTYTARGAIRALEEGKVVILGAGLGTPYFSTDTAAVLRSLGLWRFACGLAWILSVCFHLPADRFYCLPDERQGRFIFREIMAGGNFGQYDARFNSLPAGAGKFRRAWHKAERNFSFVGSYPREVVWYLPFMVWETLRYKLPHQ